MLHYYAESFNLALFDVVLFTVAQLNALLFDVGLYDIAPI